MDRKPICMMARKRIVISITIFPWAPPLPALRRVFPGQLARPLPQVVPRPRHAQPLLHPQSARSNGGASKTEDNEAL